ncbi:hypothetical protein BDW60DRAFT_113857 [Aspergillus nidulans var. acristatus]
MCLIWLALQTLFSIANQLAANAEASYISTSYRLRVTSTVPPSETSYAGPTKHNTLSLLLARHTFGSVPKWDFQNPSASVPTTANVLRPSRSLARDSIKYGADRARIYHSP